MKTQRPAKKLDDRFAGPFKVLESIGGGRAFRLLLPDQWKVHPVFHPSLLKPAIGQAKRPTNPQGLVESNSTEYAVDSIVNSRINRNKLEYLVSWANYGPSDRTWEPAEIIREDVPELVQSFHLNQPRKPGGPADHAKA